MMMRDFFNRCRCKSSRHRAAYWLVILIGILTAISSGSDANDANFDTVPRDMTIETPLSVVMHPGQAAGGF